MPQMDMKLRTGGSLYLVIYPLMTLLPRTMRKVLVKIGWLSSDDVITLRETKRVEASLEFWIGFDFSWVGVRG